MDFDFNLLRSAVTVFSFIVFLGIIAWTFARARHQAFDEAAALPFCEDGTTGMSLQGGRHE